MMTAAAFPGHIQTEPVSDLPKKKQFRLYDDISCCPVCLFICFSSSSESSSDYTVVTSDKHIYQLQCRTAESSALLSLEPGGVQLEGCTLVKTQDLQRSFNVTPEPDRNQGDKQNNPFCFV